MVKAGKLVFAVLILLVTISPCCSSAQEKSFSEKLKGLVWVAYCPTNCNPEENRWPSEESIKEDLKALKQAGFNGLVTYNTQKQTAKIYPIAKEMGFQGVIAGIWNPSDQQEISLAIQNKNFIDGYCIGNEGLVFNRYSLEKLRKTAKEIKKATGRPVTTSEPVYMYFKDRQLVNFGEWLFPVVHPWWAGIKEPEAGVRYTVEQYKKLAALTKKPVLIKETGLPSAGSPECSEEKQAGFYELLRTKNVSFVYFEGFDQVWKVSKPWVKRSPIETHWGIFTATREPKLVAKNLMAAKTSGKPLGLPEIEFTYLPPYGSFENLKGRVKGIKNPSDYNVAVYIYVAGWWTKPYWDEPLTPVNPDGSFVCDITTGGIDEQATRIRAYLLPKGYIPPLARGEATLPEELEHKKIAVVEAERSPWKVKNEDRQLKIFFSESQYAALHLDSSYLRLVYGPSSGWGTSVIVFPSFWEKTSGQERYWQGNLNQPLHYNWKIQGNELVLFISGEISSLKVNGEIAFAPPQKDLFSAAVCINVEGKVKLADRPGEAFKPVMLSSMHISQDIWDAREAYADCLSFKIPSEGWIIRPPAGGRVFGLRGGTSVWKTNSPTIEIHLEKPMPVTGWVTPSKDPNDDNLGFWAASDQIVSFWKYRVIATKDKNTARKN